MKRCIPLFLIVGLAPLLHAQNEEKLAKWLERYPESDANKDGTLTMEEVRTFREALMAKKGERKEQKRAEIVPPTHADVAYGPHERHRFDLWIPGKSADGDDLPFPVLLYIHGGGFVSGDKSGFDPTRYLELGIACASNNYRFVDGETVLSPQPMEDCARALQTLRHRASEWNLDPGRFALTGNSAGAVASMWLGFHDDLANPDSEDPVERESTRVTCIAPTNGPTNLIPSWIHENLGGPAHVHGSYPKMFGVEVSEDMPESAMKLIKESSPWELASADDPPTLLLYNTEIGELPLPADATTGRLIHHPYFGKALDAKLDELGVESEFFPEVDPRQSDILISFLRNQFGMVE